MAYSLHILGRAERDIKKLNKHSPKLVPPIAEQIRDLAENPRPDKYRSVEGQKDVYRIHSDDDKHRIIYSIQENLQAVLIITVRRKNEGTYKNISVENLSDKIELLTQEVNEIGQAAKALAHEMDIAWIIGLEEDQIWNLGVGIQAIKDGRSSFAATAEQVRIEANVGEDIPTITGDLERLLQKI